MLVIHGGSAVTRNGVIDDAVIVVRKGIIADIGVKGSVRPPSGAKTVDAKGFWITPGFVDIHVHGGGGNSFATSDPDEVIRAARFLASTGTTSLLATVGTGPLEKTQEFISVIADLIGSCRDSAEIVGIHLEGPFVNACRRGAINAQHIRPPSIDETDRTIELSKGSIRVMTLAPEIDGALQVIGHLTGRGIVVSIGHSDAKYDDALAGINAGISHSTHTYNAMSGLHHRKPGVVGAVLTNESVTCELIGDLVHVSPAAAQVLIRCKGSHSVALITDNAFAAGLPDGRYSSPDGRYILKNHAHCTLDDGTLAGSVSPMNMNVRNLVTVLGTPLTEAVEMASLTPARSAGVDDRKGSLCIGKDADIVIMNKRFEVMRTYVAGDLIYDSWNSSMPAVP